MSTDSGPNSHTLDPWFAGIDVGGTSIKIGVISAAGQIVEETSIPTQDERGPEEVGSSWAIVRLAESAQQQAAAFQTTSQAKTRLCMYRS